MPAGFQDLIIERCDLLHFEAPGPLFEAGDDAGGVYGLVEGALELHLPIRRNAPTLSYVGGPGFWAGDVAAMTGNARRIALLARASSWVLRLSRSELVRTTQEDPKTWPFFMVLLARNLTTAMDLIEALKIDDTAERIAATLLILSAEECGDPPLLDISQTDLGAVARLARSSVNSALSTFEQCGWIKRRYRNLELSDRRALREFAEGGLGRQSPASRPVASNARSQAAT